MAHSLVSSPDLRPSLAAQPTDLEDRLRQRAARIVVVGLGNAGLPMAVELAAAGFPVVGYDVDAAKVGQVNAGQSPIGHLPHERIAHLTKTGTLAATTDPAILTTADVAFICVPTPLAADGTPDLHHVVDAARAIGDRLQAETLVVLQSTCPPGTTSGVLRQTLEAANGLCADEDFHVVYAPERIDPGNARFGVRNTPKLVGGLTPASTALGRLLLGSCVDQVIGVSSPEVAELAKLVENTFRFVNIEFANEMALLCERLHVNVWEVIDAAASKPFAFMPHSPGIGVGGDCIPVVPFFLDAAARDSGLDLQLVQAAARIDAAMPRHTVDKLEAALAQRATSLVGARVLAIGVTYKPDVAGTANSAALRVLAEAQMRGARVAYHDPYTPSVVVGGQTLHSKLLTRAALDEADAVLVLTPHRTVDFDLVARYARLVVDTRPGRETSPDNTINVWTTFTGTRDSLGSSTRPKFLLYSHDTYGLGNIRRTLLLAEALASEYPRAAILIITGSPMIHAFRIPSGVDYIKLPCLDRVAAERYEPRFLASWAAEVKRIRASLIEQAVLGFAPDLMIVDKRPGGVDGELVPVLRRLRESHASTRLVLGIRDILDAPERTRRSFANSRTFETIVGHYDEVWIYGEQSIFDAVKEYGFPASVAALTHYCGYLERCVEVPPRIDATPHVLVTTGGGGDGSRMIETYLQGLSDLPPDRAPRTTVVLGPELPSARRAALLERFAHLGEHVTFLDFEPDLPLLLAQSDLVVSMAGYNTICELLLFARRAVLIPRAEPVQEQLIRARLFAQRGYFDMLEPDQLEPTLLMNKVLAGLARPRASRPADEVDRAGLARIRRRVRALLGAAVAS